MGYAFLYGVVGSLVGSNLGGVMYEAMLKPLAGQTGVESTVQTFWLIFAGLGTVTMLGLVLYNRFFARDTPQANKIARQLMRAIYSLLILLGGWFFYDSVTAETVAYKTMVQALIMLIIGGGGILISLKHKIS
jgi:hypothetical protein